MLLLLECILILSRDLAYIGAARPHQSYMCVTLLSIVAVERDLHVCGVSNATVSNLLAFARLFHSYFIL
jgi:hypothetical protein